jgi:spore coat protein U-like protein
VLSYGIFRDASRTALWGYTPGIDTVSQTLKVLTSRGVDASFTVYGRIPALQDVTPGDYTDTVQVTLSP